jgi:hypothetical protein
MGRVFAVGLLVSGFVLAACGENSQAAHRATTVMSVPLIASPSPIPDTGAAWTPVVAAQTQAAQLAVAEEQYATCVAYAGLNQSLVAASASGASPFTSCATTGLNAPIAAQIQTLVVQAA